MSFQFHRKKPSCFKTAGIRSYFSIKVIALLTLSKPFPYPIIDEVNKPTNSPLHEAVLNHDDEILHSLLSSDKLDLKTYTIMLHETSLRNTPLMLAIKLGRWDMFCQMVKKLHSLNVSYPEIQDCFTGRDSMGLMLLSYAVALRAPETVIRYCLKYTPKYSFYFDERYHALFGGVRANDVEKPLYQATERGFIVGADLKGGLPQDKQRGFEIYAMPLNALYSGLLPDEISFTNEIADQIDFKIHSKSEKSHKDLLLHQVLRNLIFHLPALCESYGTVPKTHPESVVRSTQHFAFDVEQNYPMMAAARNTHYDHRVQRLIESWEAMPMEMDRWVAPTDEVLDKSLDRTDEPGAMPSSS